MPTSITRSEESPIDRQIVRALVVQQYVLVVVCAAVALVVGYLGSKVATFDRASQVIAAGAAVFVAIVVAVGLLRYINALISLKAATQSDYSAAISETLIRRLEKTAPDVAEQARQIDPSDLLRDGLERLKSRQGTPSGAP